MELHGLPTLHEEDYRSGPAIIGGGNVPCSLSLLLIYRCHFCSCFVSMGFCSKLLLSGPEQQQVSHDTPKTFPATATRTGSAANSIKRFAGRSRTTCSLRWDCRIGPRSSRTDTNQFPLIQPWRLQSKHWDLAERGRGNSNNNKINNQRNTNWKRTDDCRLLCRSIRRPGAGGGSEVAVVYYLRGETMAHRL